MVEETKQSPAGPQLQHAQENHETLARRQRFLLGAKGEALYLRALLSKHRPSIPLGGLGRQFCHPC